MTEIVQRRMRRQVCRLGTGVFPYRARSAPNALRVQKRNPYNKHTFSIHVRISTCRASLTAGSRAAGG